MGINYNNFKEYPILIRQIVDYFTAYEDNPAEFEKIKTVCLKFGDYFGNEKDIHLIETGYLTPMDFYLYMSETKQMDGGIPTELVDQVVASLVEHKFLGKLDTVYGITSSGRDRYKPYKDISYASKNDLILNKILGFQYIIDKYKMSIFKVTGKNQKGDERIGTGFFTLLKNESGKSLPIIITNKHVVENVSNLKVLSKSDQLFRHIKVYQDSIRDLAYIVLDAEETKNLTSVFVYPKFEVVEDILTIGYPYIPFSRDSYQVCHLGEVNTEIEDIEGNKLFLFSAKTSSGNSGSPIINSYGACIGITTRELFEKEAFEKMGKPPYWAFRQKCTRVSHLC